MIIAEQETTELWWSLLFNQFISITSDSRKNKEKDEPIHLFARPIFINAGIALF